LQETDRFHIAVLAKQFETNKTSVLINNGIKGEYLSIIKTSNINVGHMSSYSADVAKAILLIESSLNSSPEELDSCLDSCESNSELFLILFLLFKELTKDRPEWNLECVKLQHDYLRLDFGRNERNYFVDVLNKLKKSLSLEQSTKWEALICRVKDALINRGFQETPPSKSQDSRRMFESIASAHSISSQHDRSTIKRFYPKYFPEQGDLPSIEEVEDFICNKLMSFKSDYAWSYYDKRFGNPKEPSQIYNGEVSATQNYRGRDQGKSAKDIPQVRSFGIMKSTTPKPMYMLDRELSFKGKASQSDKNTPDYKKHQLMNWLVDNSESPFVASYSGHSVWLMGLLIEHAKTIRDTALRNEFIKMMMRSILATYIHQGFHAYQEILTVFNDPVIINDLSDIGISFTAQELNFIDSKVVELAMLEAANYNKTCLIKRSSLCHLVVMRKLDEHKITPEQAVKKYSNNTTIILLAYERDASSFRHVRKELAIELFKSGKIKPEHMVSHLKQKIEVGDVLINRNRDFDKSTQERALEESFFLLKLAILRGDLTQINAKAKQLFCEAGTVRNFFAFYRGTFSTTTTPCATLIALLLTAENRYILEGLNIISGDSEVITSQLKEKMEQAFLNDNIIEIPTQLSSRDHLGR
jgi:hypothetical protein